jgi:hypothetical protein
VSYDAANQRSDYKRTLAVQWIRQNRPDVMELITKLAEEKYPAVRPVGRKSIEMPEVLRNFK